MTDRELLELAAKAAGYDVRWHDDGHYGPTMEIMEDESGGPPWNPLTDDGDALRLAVKLGLSISCRLGTASAWTILIEIEERYEADPYAATRRAIVRSAAEIGMGIITPLKHPELPKDDYYKTMNEAFEIGRTK